MITMDEAVAKVTEVFGPENVIVNALLDAALTYADMGWEVFPTHNGPGCSCWRRERCQSPGKHPRTRNGVKDATTDMDQIERWWRMWPQSNIGIRTGDQLLVLDLDGDEGSEVLHAWTTTTNTSTKNLEATDTAPASFLNGRIRNCIGNRNQESAFLTPRVLTGNGTHLYFQAPTQTRVRAQVGVIPGVDIRIGDSYVIAPPSVHASGRTYEWEVGHSPVTDMPLAEVPAVVMRVLEGNSRSEKPRVPKRIKVGKRNDLFYRLACSFWAQEIPEEAIERVLIELLPRTEQPPGDEFTEEHVRDIVRRVTEDYAPGRSSDRALRDMRQRLGMGEQS